MDAIWSFYNAHVFWSWAGLGAGLLAIEVLTGSGWLLWASASAVATAALAALAGLSPPTAGLAFAALTIASTLLARRYLPRRLLEKRHDINDNVARLVGHEGLAVGPFAGRAGRVTIDGKEWAAELEGDDPLEAGARIEVVRVRGATLTVRPA